MYYSPTVEPGSKEKLQAFTAIGVVRAGDPYRFDMGGGFCPFRRDVDWIPAREAPIQPLLDGLEFSAGNKNWGYQLRFGLFVISDHDMRIIAGQHAGSTAGLGLDRSSRLEAVPGARRVERRACHPPSGRRRCR